MKNANSDLFESLISQIRTATPELKTTESKQIPKFVNVQYSWADQPGLSTELHLSLQHDDEVHLCIGREFWAEFRPVTDPKVRAEVYDRVLGFMSGDCRIRVSILVIA
jgi:hypothetical protein